MSPSAEVNNSRTLLNVPYSKIMCCLCKWNTLTRKEAQHHQKIASTFGEYSTLLKAATMMEEAFGTMSVKFDDATMSNRSEVQMAAAVFDHFPPWMNLLTLLIVVFFFGFSLYHAYAKKKVWISNEFSTPKRVRLLLGCCLYDSYSQVVYWTVPLQFSLSYLLAFSIRVIHAVCLQYFFSQTYEFTCIHYLDDVAGKMRRMCPLVTFIDRSTESLIKATYLLLFVYWLELSYRSVNRNDSKKCKRFERSARRIYWALFGLYYFVFSLGFFLFVISLKNISYFFNAILLIIDIMLPVLFLGFGFRLNYVIRSVEVTHPPVILKFLRRVSLFCKVIGSYFILLPIDRILNFVLTNFLFAANGYDSISTFIIVAEYALFLCLPSIVTFSMVMVPTGLNFISKIKTKYKKPPNTQNQPSEEDKDGVYYSMSEENQAEPQKTFFTI